MKISFKHKWLFIHIPKTGGTSLSAALAPWNYRVRFSMQLALAAAHGLGLLKNPYENFKWRLGRYSTGHFIPYHISAAEVKNIMPPGYFETFFKFAIVRNPWDLLVSYWHFIHEPRIQWRQTAEALGTFPRFVEWFDERLPKRPGQYLYITDHDGKLLVDYVGRFEQLQESVDVIGKRIGIDLKLPHLNRSSKRPSKDYRSYYDDKLRERVAQIYRRDIELFGYDFDGLRQPTHRQVA